MSKVFTFLFAILILLFSLLIYSFRLSENGNFINESFRPLFLKSALAREVFILDKIGDKRYEYVSPHKAKILVEVDWQREREPDKDIRLWLEDLIYQTIGKSVEVKINLDDAIGDLDEFSDMQLREMAKSTQDYFTNSEQSYLHIFYISKSAETPTNFGLVLTDDDVFIFKDTINELTDIPAIRARIEESTIKHEFGHLLGLEHVVKENCVMSESVEVYGNRRRQFENSPIEYCEDSLREINKLMLE